MIDFLLPYVQVIQDVAAPIPYLNYLSSMKAQECLILLGGVSVAVILLALSLIVGLFRSLRRGLLNRAIKNFFGVTDLSRFKIKKMGRPGSKYYMEDGVNSFTLSFPHWKYPNEDGSRAKKFLNKIVWEESILWLHAGRKVYVLRTDDLYDMLYLVHTLREGGLDIAPCQQELEKQERLERAKRPCDEVIEELVAAMDGNTEKFVELCRQRLTLRGFAISDAPKNSQDIRLFFRRGTQPNVVKCQLVPRDSLLGIDEVKAFKEASEDIFADACTLITTGRISVAAAGFARANAMDVVCNERLVELMEEAEQIPAEKAYLRWEINDKDVQLLLPEDLFNQIIP